MRTPAWAGHGYGKHAAFGVWCFPQPAGFQLKGFIIPASKKACGKWRPMEIRGSRQAGTHRFPQVLESWLRHLPTFPTSPEKALYFFWENTKAKDPKTARWAEEEHDENLIKPAT